MTAPHGEIFGSWADYRRFRSRFADELDPALYTLDWLDVEVFSGRMRLLSCGNSAILLSFRDYPTGLRELHGEFATGELDVILTTLIPAAEALGRANGCSTAVIQSRSGWVKVMKNHGYERFQTSIRKGL